MIYNTIDTKKARKIHYNSDKHIPNKSESKQLRKLKAKTGMTEDEIRCDIRFRKQLSDASKSNQQKMCDKSVKWYRYRIKCACKKTGLVPQHPKTIGELQSWLDTYDIWSIPWYVYPLNRNANSIIKSYI